MLTRSLLTIPLIFAVVACGGDGAPDAGEPSATQSTAAKATDAAERVAQAMAMPDPVPIDRDPCALLTAEDASTYLEDIQEPEQEGGTESRPFRECAYKGGFAGADSVRIGVAGGLDEAAFDGYVVGNAELAGDEANLRSVEGVGDKAYSRRGTAWVLAGDVTLSVSVSTLDLEGDQADAAAVELAKTVVGRL